MVNVLDILTGQSKAERSGTRSFPAPVTHFELLEFSPPSVGRTVSSAASSREIFSVLRVIVQKY